MKIPRTSVGIEPVPAEGMTLLQHRWGGNKPLPVFETIPGVFTSAWIINKEAQKLLRNRKAALTVVIDTNVPGHPTISIKFQIVHIIPD